MKDYYNAGDKCYAVPSRFDPEQDTTLAKPPGCGYGHWAGAPSAAFDASLGRFYVYYRVRRPLSEGRVAVSDGDGKF